MRWTKGEELELFKLVREDKELTEISNLMNKSVTAIRKKLTREGFEAKYVYRRILK